jgi:hypothetical protein
MLVLLLALLLNGLGVGWGLPLRGIHGWDIDGIAPMGPLVAAKRMIIDDWWNSGYYNKYPMGHFFLLMIAYAPYLGYLRITGGLGTPSEVYPFGLQDPETALTVLTLIARGVNVLMGVGIVLLVYLTGRRLGGRHVALFSALTVALCPAFIFYAHTGNIDTPSLFWCALGLFAFSRVLTGVSEWRTYVLLGVAAGMAAATKEQTVGLFLLLPLSVVILHTQHSLPAPRPPSAFLRAAFDPRLLGGLVAAGVTFAIATHLVFNWDGNMLRLRSRIFGIHPISGTVEPETLAGPVGPVRGLAEFASHTAEAMNPLLVVAGVAGLVTLGLRRQWARHFAMALVSYVALSVSMMHFIAARFVMEVVLILAFFVGHVAASLWTLGVQRSRALVAVLVVAWVYSFAYGFEVDYLLLRDARYAAEAWFERHASPGATVEAFSAPTYLPRFPPHLHVQHHPDLTSAELDTLKDRSPDFLVLSSAYSRRFQEGSDDGALLARLLRGDFGYRPIRTFRREPLLWPRLFAGLSPEIVVLANHR